MTSRNGILASSIFLAAIPTALIAQAIFSAGAENVLHLMFGCGALLLASAAFRMTMPQPLRIAGAVVIGGLGITFLMQGVADLIGSEPMQRLAYHTLGQVVERIMVDATLLWFASTVIIISRGIIRLVGVISVGAAILVELYGNWLSYHGTTLNDEFAALKLVMLAPFFWLLLECLLGRRSQARPRAL